MLWQFLCTAALIGMAPASLAQGIAGSLNKLWEGPAIERFACQADAIFQGECDQEHLGQSVSSGGDWNGDGIPDLLLGGGDKIDAGLVITGYKNVAWIALGPQECGATFCLEDWHLRLEGEQTDDRFGHSFRSVGDLDGDGRSDLAAGAPLWDRLSPGPAAQDAGSLYLFLARDQADLPPLPAQLQAGQFGSRPRDPGITSLIVRGLNTGERFGLAVCGLGDLDGDGLGELLVGAPGSSVGPNSFPGRAYLFFGQRLAQWFAAGVQLVDASEADVFYEGEAPRDRFGYSLAPLADLDSDGAREFAVGAIQDPEFPGGPGPSGPGYVAIYGVNQSGLPTLWTRIEGRALGERFGHALCLQNAPLGVDPPLLLVGAPRAAGAVAGAGRVDRLALGGLVPGASAHTADSFLGENEGDQFGWSLSGGEDVDGDGLADFAVGARDFDFDGPNTPCAAPNSGGFLVGRAYVYRGVSGSLFARMTGEEQRDRFGWSVALLPDQNGNGRAELVIGALAWPKTAVADCGCPLGPSRPPTLCDEFGRAYLFRF